jgi:3-oxoadipate enol-lactonase/4-carboxymuconolactone decarboxylase
MIPGITAVRMSGARHRGELPLLVLGPSLGTTASTLWADCAAGLTDAFDVLAWDLPGHGHNRSVPEEPFTIAELAAGVLAVVDDILEQRGELGGSFLYAGVSVGGAVGLQLLLDAPARVEAAAVLSTGARIGSPDLWMARIGQVSASGTPAMVVPSAEHWFGPDFLEREPERGSALLVALQNTVDEGYLQVCAALADFDVRDRLAEIEAPVLAVAGNADALAPPPGVREIADGVQDGRFVELEGVAHLTPAEAPETVAALLREHFLGETVPEAPEAADFTREFQRLVTDWAAGGIGNRPGLDRRSRSLVTLTALVARGHHEELATQVRAALRHGLSVDELTEVLLQTALLCGVPDATRAFRVVQRVLEEEGQR